MTANVEILPDAQQLYWRAAEEFLHLSLEAVGARGIFNVALSGGSTPRGLYALLADEGRPFYSRIPWQRTHVFWADERCVPLNHPDSNYRMASEALLSRVPVSAGNIHRIRVKFADAAAAARDYERLLRLHFRLEPGQMPGFDLILLGMGADGHTASMFPGSPALKEQKKLAAAVWDAKKKIHRITLTLPVLNSAANIRFLVAGPGKAEAVRKALDGGLDSVDLPACSVHPAHGSLVWFLDLAAAGCLPQAIGGRPFVPRD